MADIEKVVKGLEMCIADEYCNGCPYEVQCYSPGQEYAESMMREALELLKEQEKIKEQFIEAFNTIRYAYNMPVSREEILLNYLLRNACCCE